MRFLKFKNSFNWQYVTGEILLIFIGINLAIWFNNWNSARKTTRDKEVAIIKIKEEIENNIEELTKGLKSNQLILSAYSDYKKLYDSNTSEIISTPNQLSKLQQKYPSYFGVTDSVEVKTGLFRYKGRRYIELELIELTAIAWETTRSIRITNEFDYECLYELESLYNLQRRVQNELDKAVNTLQKGKIDELMNILGFMNQLDLKLKQNYENMLESIDNCS